MKIKSPFIALPFILLAGWCIMASCSSAPRSLSLSTPHNKIINGSWVVDSVTSSDDFTGADLNNIVLFNDANPSCFVGSNWTISGDGTGSYSVATRDCPKGVRSISWNILTAGKEHFIAFLRETAPKGILVARYTNYTVEISDIQKGVMVFKYPVLYANKTGNIFIKMHKVDNK